MTDLTTTETAQLPAIASAPYALIAAWHEHLALSVQAGDVSDTTVSTYRAGLRKAR
jgi:hypothetical protein